MAKPEPEGPTEAESAANTKPIRQRYRRSRQGSRSYQRHGLGTLKRAVTELGGRAIDGRSALGRALASWRTDLIQDLGGPDAVSTQQAAMVDLAVRTKLLVDSVDAFVLGMNSPINKRRRSLYPVVRERQALVSQLQSLLRDLGLERRVKAVPDLAAYVAAKSSDGSSPGEADIDVSVTPQSIGETTQEGMGDRDG